MEKNRHEPAVSPMGVCQSVYCAPTAAHFSLLRLLLHYAVALVHRHSAHDCSGITFAMLCCCQSCSLQRC